MSDGFQVCRLSDEIADGEWLATFPSANISTKKAIRKTGKKVFTRKQWVVASTAAIAS
jgi:hypothetical protein